MVTALVKGKRREIHNLDDLAEAVEVSRHASEPLVLLGEGEQVINPATATESSSSFLTWKPTQEQIDRTMSAAGGWKNLVDTDQLKQDLLASKGQAPRDWEPCSS